MNKLSDVSVIIPCYNCENYIDKTVTSLISQTIKPKEIVLINDASADGTLMLLNTLEKSYANVVKVIHFEEKKGVSFIRNHGAILASGEYLLFMDADDIADPMLIEKQWNRLQELNSSSRDKYILCYSAYVQIDNENRIISNVVRGIQVDPSETLGYFFYRNLIISTSGVMLKKKIFIATGAFNENLKYSEDWDLWLRIARLGGFAYIDEPLVQIRRHESNASAKISNMLESEKKIIMQYEINTIKEAIFKRRLSIERNCSDFVSLMFRIDLWDQGYTEIAYMIEKGYDYYNFHFNLGLYYLKKRDLELALTYFLRVVNKKADHGAALNNIGCLYLLQRDIPQAKEYFYKAIDLFPNYMDAMVNLALSEDRQINFTDLKFTHRELRSVLLNYNG